MTRMSIGDRALAEYEPELPQILMVMGGAVDVVIVVKGEGSMSKRERISAAMRELMREMDLSPEENLDRASRAARNRKIVDRSS